MTEITLVDGLILLFIIFKMSRAHKMNLGESLHGLIAIILIMALFMGLQITEQVRGIMTSALELTDTAPSLGSKILTLVAAWYLMRLVKTRLGGFLDKLIPQKWKKIITFINEGLRSLLLALFTLWFFSAWFPSTYETRSIGLSFVRASDSWIAWAIDRPVPVKMEEPSFYDEGSMLH